MKRYEAIDDRLGRIMSYAGLVYSGDTTDPANAKFYGDALDKVTRAATDLLLTDLDDTARASILGHTARALYRR